MAALLSKFHGSLPIHPSSRYQTFRSDLTLDVTTNSIDGKGENDLAKGITLLHTSGWIQAELSTEEQCFWRIAVPYEGVDFQKVYLNCLKNNASVNADQSIFNIKFKWNFSTVRLVHEQTGRIDCAFIPQRGALSPAVTNIRHLICWYSGTAIWDPLLIRTIFNAVNLWYGLHCSQQELHSINCIFLFSTSFTFQDYNSPWPWGTTSARESSLMKKFQSKTQQNFRPLSSPVNH